jgi:hypothetical protein
MRQIFELNFIRFVLHPNHGEEMFFEEQEMVIGYWFNHLVDGVVCKLFGVKW